MCDCNRLKLYEQGTEHESSLYFDGCLCQPDHEVFEIKCEDCRYNVYGFARNYFTSVTLVVYTLTKMLLVLTVDSLQIL